MTEDRLHAVALALELARTPTLASVMRHQALPQDILTLIRIASGDPERSSAAATAFGCQADAIKDAASLYLHEVVLHGNDDHYRTLGVRPDASEAQIREHFRCLMKWLHPDSNGQAWGSVFAGRVLEAWNALKTPERRANYDVRRRSEAPKPLQPSNRSVRPLRIPRQAPVRRRPVQTKTGQVARANSAYRWIGAAAGFAFGSAIMLTLRPTLPASLLELFSSW